MGLTAINIPVTGMAEAALRELQAMLQGQSRPEPRIITVAQSLAVRGSTAPPPKLSAG